MFCNFFTLIFLILGVLKYYKDLFSTEGRRRPLNVDLSLGGRAAEEFAEGEVGLRRDRHRRMLSGSIFFQH